MKNLFKGFIMCLTMFTIIPMPYVEWDEDGAKNMMKFYPIIGFIIGIIWFVGYKLINYLNISMVLKSILIMIIPFIITGMLHLDGFMDVCDAILSRRDREEKLRILKDSATGAFAVVSVIILFFIEFGAMYSFLEYNKNPYILIFLPIISRSIAAYFLISTITIKESVLGSYFKKGTNIQDRVILILELILAYIFFGLVLGYIGIVILPIVIVAISWCVRKCFKEFGGISGDVAGFSLVVGEVVGLLSACIF
ncbi:adenosylcobinamide-GDP ribazoletransferase [Clostridium taeniosporum]|uniref:Adenosylcobinamide-GDP ribazoletransferase n=1 Tax=Clostridium taeniosporum TaxID=394958 RepID=A0A1D7XLR9_9CLOT|nr:adenosylcobinamide-GDP ribazoletransferase [Clostridium taeniosporum]AOR24264.1 adenosylcobinamide-GDP ribazoletransferase [Clostridium taeniosporum]